MFLSKLNSLYTKLTLTFLAMVAVCGGAIWYFSTSTSETYSLEIMQRLNKSVAMYVAGQQPLIAYGAVDQNAMDELASRAMILNPSLEIYLLDTEGKILSHRLPEGAVKLQSVDTQPIRDFLSESTNMPILGTDPRLATKTNVFSVAPIEHNGELQGYVYAVIGGALYQNLQESITSSHTLRFSAAIVFLGALVTAAIGGILFFVLTRRLTQLRGKVEQFGVLQLGDQTNTQLNLSSTEASSNASSDEIGELDHAFTTMAVHINQQFDAISSMDATRRELIANVSHDLRTPLASMQGYIETLIIKDDTLNNEQKKDYLQIAYKHSKRLSDLVSELFELAKLEAHGIEPKMEQFSLLELVHDSVQEFGLSASKRDIQLDIDAYEDRYVIADIALIQRVLQNLLDNALRHTPDGGRVKISLTQRGHKTVVSVSDTGSGIQTHEIPFIFDRFYQSQQQSPSDNIGTGLGLAIVKRILDLHQSHIDVKSRLNEGTSFIFELPQQA